MTDHVLRDELDLATRACELYPRNHAAYAHRAFCLACASPALQSQERDATSRWLDRHLADHSAAQHLDSLARRAGEPERETVRRQARELLSRYPSRETAWMLLRRCARSDHAEDRALLVRHLTGDGTRTPGDGAGIRRHAVRATVCLLQRVR
jgi:protein prenyltransferase alpha subunit repeat containing protein 1